MIKEYFKKIENTIENYSHIIDDYILNKQTFSDEKGSIEGEIFFNNDSQLDFLEVINTNEQDKQKYSYHYMNDKKKMIFRYDNAKHHPEIKTYPHHKHTKSGIEESKKQSIENVMIEIENEIITESNIA